MLGAHEKKARQLALPGFLSDQVRSPVGDLPHQAARSDG